jgi:aconitase A
MELTSPRLVGFKAKAALCTPARLLAVWTELVRRHALLGACVEYSGEGTAKFV